MLVADTYTIRPVSRYTSCTPPNSRRAYTRPHSGPPTYRQGPVTATVPASARNDRSMVESQSGGYVVSASADTTTSPAAASVPVCRAAHTPGVRSWTTRAPSPAATAAVSSGPLLSTTRISSLPANVWLRRGLTAAAVVRAPV